MDQPKELGVGGVDKTIESTHCTYITHVNVHIYRHNTTQFATKLIIHKLLPNHIPKRKYLVVWLCNKGLPLTTSH